jgi:TfuA protein
VQMHNTVVFLGPSLDLASARSVLDATYLPPIKRSDLSKLDRDIKTVCIIDGEFFQSLAVSPKEVLPLLDRGVKIFGSSSMGALRAAETHIYGMVGVGPIFEMYRDGLIDADDEVALTYDPTTYKTTSESLVNLRFALRDAVQADIIKQSKADEIINRLRGVYFPYRSYQFLNHACPQLKGFLEAQRRDQKRDDTLLLLHTVARLGEEALANKNPDAQIGAPITTGSLAQVS